MSASPEERGDDARDVEEGVGEEMEDMTDLPPAQNGNNDGLAVGDQVEDHRISELLELERKRSAEQQEEDADAADTGVVNRYKQLAQDEVKTASDDGSTDILPRRAASPIDSTVSIPDDTPSVQVCRDCCFARDMISEYSVRMLTILGIRSLLSKQHHPAITSLETSNGQSESFLPTIRPPLPVSHCLPEQSFS